jgi:uncharacterized peroxidase-related enzyme
MPFIQTIEPDSATGPLAEIYSDILQKRGDIANIYQLSSLDPEFMRVHRQMYETLMLAPGGLSRVEREAIAVAVSVSNGCHYAIWHHSEALRAAGGNEPLIVSLLLGEMPDDESDRIEKLVYFARKLTLLPNEFEEKDILELRETGFSDNEILQATHIIAFWNYANRLANGLGVELERE